MTDNVFFQHGDEPDAANFAHAFGLSVRTSYIISGFGFTVDLTTPSLDVAAGVAAIWRGDMDTSSPDIDPTETRSETAHPVEKDAVAGIALTDNDVNHVYLDTNVGTSDSPTIAVNTTGSEPSAESVKIGEVDTNESTASAAISDQWRLITETATLTFPDKAAASATAGDLRDGSFVRSRSAGRQYIVNGAALEALLTPVETVVADPDRNRAAELDDGDSIEIPIPVEDGETLNVYRWGAFDASDHTAPTGLDVELVDGSDVVQVAANTTNSQNLTSPVASLTNTSGGIVVYKLRAKNDTGSPIGDTDTAPGVGAHFGFRVE